MSKPQSFCQCLARGVVTAVALFAVACSDLVAAARCEEPACPGKNNRHPEQTSTPAPAAVPGGES